MNKTLAGNYKLEGNTLIRTEGEPLTLHLGFRKYSRKGYSMRYISAIEGENFRYISGLYPKAKNLFTLDQKTEDGLKTYYNLKITSPSTVEIDESGTANRLALIYKGEE